MATGPERIVYGEREAMIAEYAAFDPRRAEVPARECKYLVVPLGEAQWDTEYFPTLKEAREHAKYLARSYHIGVETI